jgi:Trypsin-like peptidase domain
MWAAGLVLGLVDGAWEPAGTAAAYNGRNAYATAAHCVPEGTEVAIVVTKGTGGTLLRPAQRIVRHPEIDLAVVILDPSEEEPGPLEHTFYHREHSALIDAANFVAYGYPLGGGNEPIGRTFKGHVQRYFDYAPAGEASSYYAAELSIATPVGLSGGPVAYDNGHGRGLVAVVTANHQIENVVTDVTEVDSGGQRHTERTAHIVSYGIAAVVKAEPVADWLDEAAGRSPYVS